MTTDAPVGIVGLGLMGIALSARLIDAKIPLVGFDIDPVRCGMFKASGGMVANSVRELAGRCRTIIVAVYSGEQVEALFDEIDDGAGAVRPVVICTTTCGPGEIIRIAARASGAGLPLVEAPISGTSTEVLDGTATALLAGDDGVIDHAGGLLNILCPRSLRVGVIGDASRAKLAINLILQNNRAALAEGIAFAERMGLDGYAFLAAARQSAAYSRVMDSKGEKMLTRDYRPQSHIAQTLKDAELIIEEAGRCGMHLPLTTIQAELLRATIALEGPDRDSAAVIEAIRRRSALPEVLR
ncbi:NAD(P)-dependent oxidoreductase [Bradyrhizobium sp. AUGA SZCCT0177]|uniref:NAD(P)-dependent oxidoreductase n=1 Tax=Bradyrhizobium sp. AUGA SZCCT0177 TaxID=2807665 RepID=UPI001BAC957E|nr:NAD(P)-dependent oxidoreductase [Bradyrhizobium sp. AUGA SZCCT0177]MBR1287474.1 NAD(P)-dependent oxidoreductase [Bradyrhizobium sp. AUGA SZCCT0177]